MEKPGSSGVTMQGLTRRPCALQNPPLSTQGSRLRVAAPGSPFCVAPRPPRMTVRSTVRDSRQRSPDPLEAPINAAPDPPAACSGHNYHRLQSSLPQGPHDVRKLVGVRPMRIRVRHRRAALLTDINPAHPARATVEQTVIEPNSPLYWARFVADNRDFVFEISPRQR